MKQDESTALNSLNKLKQNKREYTGIKNDKLIRAIINTCKDFLGCDEIDLYYGVRHFILYIRGDMIFAIQRSNAITIDDYVPYDLYIGGDDVKLSSADYNKQERKLFESLWIKCDNMVPVLRARRAMIKMDDIKSKIQNTQKQENIR